MFRCLGSCVSALLVAMPLAADPLEGVVGLEVLPGWRTEQGTHLAGLRVTLAPGWKTYWRAPGDAGIPPQFDWSGSENISGVTFHWPVPDVSHANGMRSIVYEDQVVIPMEFRLGDAGQPARIEADMQIGVCDEICIPVSLHFETALPVDGARDAQIAAALIDRPHTAAEAGVTDVTCALRPTEDGMAVTARIDMPPMGRDEAVVIEAGNQEVWVSEPDTRREGGELMASAEMIHVTGAGFALDRSAIRITVFGNGQAVDIQGCGAG